MDGSILNIGFDGNSEAVDALSVRPASIEAWPAAGGGLLLGMIVPPLAGAAPLCRKAKSLFIRIGTIGPVTVIIPYLRLEPEVLRCAAELVAAELDFPTEALAMDNPERGSTSILGRCSADLGPTSELSLMLLAAVARTLLVLAAAELWNIAWYDCLAHNGLVTYTSAQRSASYAELAGEAALLALPGFIALRSGRRIALRPERVALGSRRSVNDR